MHTGFAEELAGAHRRDLRDLGLSHELHRDCPLHQKVDAVEQLPLVEDHLALAERQGADDAVFTLGQLGQVGEPPQDVGRRRLGLLEGRIGLVLNVHAHGVGQRSARGAASCTRCA